MESSGRTPTLVEREDRGKLEGRSGVRAWKLGLILSETFITLPWPFVLLLSNLSVLSLKGKRLAGRLNFGEF